MLKRIWDLLWYSYIYFMCNNAPWLLLCRSNNSVSPFRNLVLSDSGFYLLILLNSPTLLVSIQASIFVVGDVKSNLSLPSRITSKCARLHITTWASFYPTLFSHIFLASGQVVTEFFMFSFRLRDVCKLTFCHSLSVSFELYTQSCN